MSEELTLSRHGPWIVVAADAAAVETLAAPVRRGGGVVRRMDGARMRTEGGLHAEFARALSFPAYFGHNWAALEDCLIDLEWLPAPAYLLVVDDAAHLLEGEPPERTGLFGDLLVRVAAAWGVPVEDGEWWDRAGVAFHVVLVVEGAGPAERRAAAHLLHQRWAAVGVEVALRP